MDRAEIVATVRGIAIDYAGRSLGWALTLLGLWTAVAVVVGSVVMAEKITEVLR